MITSEKLEQVAQIGSLACVASGEDNFSDIILARIERLLGAEASIFYDMSGSYARPVFGQNYYRKLEQEYGDIYGEYYNQFDPCFKSLSPEQNLSLLSTSSTRRAIFNEKDYEESEYYQDFLRPQNIHSSIIFSLKNDENLLGLFGFQRSKRHDMFDEDSHLLVRLIAAPLLQALEKRRNNLSLKPSRLSVDMNPHNMTPRQVEIAKLVTLGLSNPEISRELNISPKTVENHLTLIYAQTKAKNRVTLAQALSVILHTAQ